MNYDIVTRLLDYTPEQKDIDLARLMYDAANEIERLRAECFKWEQNAKRFANRLDQALVDGEITELGL